MTVLRSNIAYIFIILLQMGIFDAEAADSNYSEHSQNSNITKWENIVNRYKSFAQFASSNFPFSLQIARSLYVINIVVGIPSNLISFIVWSRRRIYKDNSAAIYIAALSLNDFLVLWLLGSKNLHTLWNISIFKLDTCGILFHYITNGFQYTSNLYILGFTFERWLAICMPFEQDRICSVKKAVISCICIAIGSFAFCSLHFIQDSNCQTNAKVIKVLEAFYSLFVPFTVLIFNVLVIKAMIQIHRANKVLKPVTSSYIVSPKNLSSVGDSNEDSSNLLTRARPSRVSSSRQKSKLNAQVLQNQRSFESRSQSGRTNFKSTTITLLALSFYMIACAILAGVTYVLEKTLLPITLEEKNNQKAIDIFINFKSVQVINNQIATTHFVIGFFIYYLTGHNFRETFHRLIRCCSVCNRSQSNYLTKRKRQKHLQNNDSVQTEAINVEEAAKSRRDSSFAAINSQMHRLFNKEKLVPGLEDCGKRNYRRPSPLSLQQKSEANPPSSAEASQPTAI